MYESGRWLSGLILPRELGETETEDSLMATFYGLILLTNC